VSNASEATCDVMLVGSFPPPHGGQAVHIQNLATFLRARGAHVRILNTGSNKSLRADGVSNVHTSRALFTALINGSRVRLVHVHVSSPLDFTKLIPVALAARSRRIPWIVTVHSGNTVRRLHNVGPLHRAAVRALLSGAARIICVNAAIQDSISPLIRPKTALVIPPYSIDVAAIAPPQPEISEFMRKHAPVITCVGLFEPAYGFEDAVQLMVTVTARYPDAGLLLIGDPRESAQCRARIAELRLEDHVRVCGNLEHDECLGVISSSALFLRPTMYDGDALSVREALTVGVPVVASATDFRPGGVVLYRRGDPGDLATQVLAVLQDETPRNTGRLCTEDRSLEQLCQLYSELSHDSC
jgi:glycogen synthase